MFSFRKDVFEKVTTLPNKTSFYWKDSFSLLSYIVLYLICAARFLSPLQWVKFGVRKLRRNTMDKESIRKNVPAIVVELYYLILAAFFGIITFTGWSEMMKPAINVISVYFFAESLVWILYYFFFRRFFEEKYAIMHTLEYIVVLPLVIFVQSCCITIVSDYSIGEAAAMLLNPEKGTPLMLLIVSVVYTAVILGLIISNLPIENIKEKGDYRHHLLVIGYGDVVKKRLLRAVYLRAQEKDEYMNVVFYDREKPLIQLVDDEGKTVKVPKGLVTEGYRLPSLTEDQNDYKTQEDLFKKRILASKILWIATPPFAHLKYMESMYYSNVFMVVEKPVTVFRNELEAFKKIHEHNSKIFCLSYYYLEKALPLTFIFRPLSFYEPYLDFGHYCREDIMKAYKSLGKLTDLEISIIEGHDSREWAYDESYGGQKMETFIHPLVLAKLILGDSFDAGSLQISEGDDGNIIRAGSIVQDTKVSLLIRKNAEESERKRYAKLSFRDGASLMMDFDSQQLTLLSENQNFVVGIKNEFRAKYSIQLDMVLRCLDEGINPSIIDGSDLQIKCLEALL